MDLTNNKLIGAIVKAEGNGGLQAEKIERDAAKPMQKEEPKQQNTQLLEEVIETFNKRG